MVTELNRQTSTPGAAGVPGRATATVLLCSAGRRPYLVRWFREALERNGVAGRVVVADADPYAPAAASADRFIRSPRISEPGYEHWLRAVVVEHEVDLALSINDFELSLWSELEPVPPALLVLGRDEQRIVEDKWAMASAAAAVGIDVPATWLGSALLSGEAQGEGERFVVKSRFGSGSAGLRFAEARDLRDAVAAAAAEVLDRRGQRVLEGDDPAAQIVVQQRIDGVEYGVDVLGDFERRYAGCLARRKLAMRHGETERAVSAEAEPFGALTRQLASLTRHRGVIDSDVILDPTGRAWLIDVNPRFGGGYPFSHLAGADAPSAIVAWALGLPVDAGWLRSRPGVVSAKAVDVVRSEAAAT
ncbi:ATP-grasp domain-containing protein [Agrococcus carbonis]|uniref:Carbamoyl-phosphate synthase large subunit n=1 Tax=Agrococcus carbonis TaxID=684552 RepID=A0A1H1RH28_9MICO|nr:ATP-grasp domain-containing protein [Agrococcus carbonis]SDS35002.1 carbamoyl-phosphate synthase large subunit [Agrococcus carbonis]